jgi:quercetin dioxygenase-like cupin family protein
MATSPRFDEIEWIARTDTVGVRINTLGAGQATPWHFHSAVADDVFCLETPVEVGLRGPDETVRLAPGQRQHVAPGRVHRVVNRAATPARYLLVQATGTYDFNAVAEGEGG